MSSTLRCRKCGSDQIRGIGLSGTVPIVCACCEACGYISGLSTVDARGSRPSARPRGLELRFRITRGARRFGLALVWIAAAAWIVWADYLSALNVSFPVSYILPVLLAANSGYRGIALAISLAMPLSRLTFQNWGPWIATEDPLVACLTQSCVLAFIALVIDGRHREVRRLRTLLRVCGWCKRVHVGEKLWQSIETYLVQHSGTELTQGLCPVCAVHFNECLGDAALPAAGAATPQDPAVGYHIAEQARPDPRLDGRSN